MANANRGQYKGKPSNKKTQKRSSGKQQKYKTKQSKQDEIITVRLNKYIAQSGLCSRREADEYIKSGLIEVNDKVVTEMGTQIHPGDKIKYNGRILHPEKKVYVVLNKPKDYITTMDDPHAEKRVIDLVKNAGNERIYPVGRLDRNTTGVLLFTNDGDLTTKLTHPKYNKKKIYHVWLNKTVKQTDMQKLMDGIELEDGITAVDAIQFVDTNDKSQIGLEIHSGKNRIVRRLFEHLDYQVKKLDRVYFAGLTKKKLSKGKWRFLTEKEISMLKMGSYE